MLALIAAGTVLIGTRILREPDETASRFESSYRTSYAYRTHLSDAAIETEFRNGVVTLSGRVREESQKYLAEEIAAALPGVHRVDNRLVVTLEGTPDSDAWVRARVRSVLALHRSIDPDTTTEVDVSEGVTILRGEATTDRQKELVTGYATDVQGVVRLKNMMTVVGNRTNAVAGRSGTSDDASITAQVKVALLLHASTRSVNTTVQTTDGVVMLSGLARNTAEKQRITEFADDIPGVRRVLNNMTFARSASAGGAVPPPVQNLRLVGTED